MPWELAAAASLVAQATSHPMPQALTKWGGALLELAHFRQGNEAYEMIEEVWPLGWHAGANICCWVVAEA